MYVCVCVCLCLALVAGVRNFGGSGVRTFQAGGGLGLCLSSEPALVLDGCALGDGKFPLIVELALDSFHWKHKILNFVSSSLSPFAKNESQTSLSKICQCQCLSLSKFNIGNNNIKP